MHKKSLDDYLLHIRLGRKYGFDFQANADEGVGKLRTFVKEQQRKHRGEIKQEGPANSVKRLRLD